LYESQYTILDDYETNSDINITLESRLDTDIGVISQPVSNQRFYEMLDGVLFNLPRDLYIEKLLQLTKSNDDDMCV